MARAQVKQQVQGRVRGEEQGRRTLGGGRTRGLIAAIAGGCLLLSLTGCTNFFSCEKASCPTTGSGGSGGTTTGPDYAYVGNSSAGTTSLSEFAIASGTLNSLGTISLGYIPVALAVAPSDNFLYVASTPGATSPGIYLYSIGSTGTLSVANGGSTVATDTVAAMAISPDGNWLFTVNTDGLTMAEYSVNTSTGALSLAGTVTLPQTTCNLTAARPVNQSCSVAVSPNGQYVVASLNVSGDAVFNYTSASGIDGNSLQLISSGYSTSNPTGDFSVALDANGYAYIAQTNSVTVYSILSTGITKVGTVTYTSGNTPRSITLSKSNSFVYTANEGAGTISGFGIGGNGSLTAISGSPFAGPTNVAALGVDNTGSYLVAVGYDATAGVALYTIDATTGALNQVSESGSGAATGYPALVAMTH